MKNLIMIIDRIFIFILAAIHEWGKYMLNDKINILRHWIMESNYTVFFGGAGVSTESGIPDFRSVDGLYRMKYEVMPEVILSHSYFIMETAKFFDFYRDKMIYTEAKPNITHKKLSELERKGMLDAVITQNIDGLHQMAGSERVLELHGSVHRNYCMNCNRFYPLEELLKTVSIPMCECGGIIKPDVVLYEEGLNQELMAESIRAISRAELLIIGGTSLSVYPAAGLIQYYRGSRMVLINKAVTSYDKEPDLFIQAGLGEVFSRI